ncbi:MAG: hypothetical protein II877_12365 [Synergistaceae bacterium]|nr:hypothetical protein [Synergistaceae bacterium]MBR0257372.1 hypothetical protein [Synergistaceae bacterium]
MAYNASKLVRLKDLKSLGLSVKAVADNLQSQIDDLNDLAEAIIGVTSSVIDNIERDE